MLAQQRLYANRTLATSLRDRHAALSQQCEQARHAIDGEHRAALAALAALYLPSLDPAALARCKALTGFSGFERRDPIAAREHERKVLTSSVARIAGEPRYRDRARLVGENGELSTALAGAQDGLAQAQVPCDRFERQEGFLDLIAASYDTPQFSVGWWRADYWKMWAAGDRICRELDLNDFGDDVLPAYKRVAEPRDVWRVEVNRLTADVHAIHELVRQHDEAANRLLRLDEIYVQQSRDYLGEHLAQADFGLLSEWCTRANDPDGDAIQIGLRRVAGIRAKFTYVDDIAAGASTVDDQLRQRIHKYDRKLAKANRGKYLQDSELADTLDAKAPGIRGQADKTSQRLDRIVAARNYDTFDPTWDHHMWWWHFTQCPPTRLCPTTRGWYDAHPEATAHVPREEAPSPLADAFMAGRETESSGGYLS